MLLNTVKIFFTLNLQNQFTTSTMYHYHIDTSLTRNHLNHFWCKQNNALLVLHSDWTVVASLPNITIVGKLFLLHFGSFMTNEQGSCYDLEHLFLHWWYRFTQNRVCLKLLIHIYFYVYVWMSMSVCHEYGYLQRLEMPALLKLELHVVVSCLKWVLGTNSQLLEEQQVLLTSVLCLSFNEIIYSL